MNHILRIDVSKIERGKRTNIKPIDDVMDCPIKYDLDKCSSSEYGYDCCTCWHTNQPQTHFIEIPADQFEQINAGDRLIIQNDKNKSCIAMYVAV